MGYNDMGVEVGYGGIMIWEWRWGMGVGVEYDDMGGDSGGLE